MAVKIRLARRGRKKRAIYDVVVADARAPRDGRFIEKLGSFNPNHEPPLLTLDVDSALKWVMDGAEPTDTARKLLSQRGVMLKKHLQVGVNKGAITQEVADKRYEEWLAGKEGELKQAADKLAKTKADTLKAKLDAEAKVSAARAEQIAKKQQVVEEAEETSADDAPAAEATEETPAAEAPTEEASAKAEKPVAEEAKEEAPAAEEVKEEAPAAEAKEDAPAAKATEKAPADDAGKEEKAAE